MTWLDKEKLMNAIQHQADNNDYGYVHVALAELHSKIESGTFDAPESKSFWDLYERFEDKIREKLLVTDENTQLREENAKLVKALERITTVTADGSTPAEWDYSTGGAGHAQCRRIATSVLSEIRGGNTNDHLPT